MYSCYNYHILSKHLKLLLIGYLRILKANFQLKSIKYIVVKSHNLEILLFLF